LSEFAEGEVTRILRNLALGQGKQADAWSRLFEAAATGLSRELKGGSKR